MLLHWLVDLVIFVVILEMTIYPLEWLVRKARERHARGND